MLILFSGINLSHSQCASNIACFAPSIDIAKLANQNMTINSTCGDPPEAFCVRSDCSLLCDASNNQTWHPASYLVDSFELQTFWKSENFLEPIFIQLDLGFQLILHQITMTFQFDELPLGLYFQRSQDHSSSFKTLAYYAIRCLEIFGLQESSTLNGTLALCYRINEHVNQVGLYLTVY